MSAEKCIHLHRWSRPTTGQDRFEVKYLRDTHKPEAILLSLTPLVFERFLPSLTLWLYPNCPVKATAAGVIRQRPDKRLISGKPIATYQQPSSNNLHFCRVGFKLLSAGFELRAGSRCRQH